MCRYGRKPHQTWFFRPWLTEHAEKAQFLGRVTIRGGGSTRLACRSYPLLHNDDQKHH